jgi:hypothetical protein
MLERQTAIRCRLRQALLRPIELAVVAIFLVIAGLPIGSPAAATVASGPAIVASVGPELQILCGHGVAHGHELPLEHGVPHEADGTHCTTAESGHSSVAIDTPCDPIADATLATTCDTAASYRDDHHFSLFRPPRLLHQA